jgi:aspartyl-tRNA(Asn)/glutamyl-tRNA(Gln) amidotransferase subunit C
MAKITQEEIIKLAQMSYIKVADEEIPHLTAEIEAVLEYASGLKQIAAAHEHHTIPMPKNKNILRPDKAVKTNPEPLLEQAPEREGDYFVVPIIISSAQGNE